jgi:hypothetical protein
MSEFKFSPGTYSTRDGRKAVVLCDDAPGDFPLIGWFASLFDDGCMSAMWERNGNAGNCGRGADLMPPEPEQVVRWVVNARRKCDGWEEISVHKTPIDVNSEWDLLSRTRVVLTPDRFDDETAPSEYDRGWNEAITAALQAAGAAPAKGGYEAIRLAIRALKREGK